MYYPGNFLSSVKAPAKPKICAKDTSLAHHAKHPLVVISSSANLGKGTYLLSLIASAMFF